MNAGTEEKKFSVKSAGRLMGMGLPMALQFSITALGTMIVQSTLNLLGETAIAAYAAAQKLQGLVEQPWQPTADRMQGLVITNESETDLKNVC